jgi:hypothetical protein
MRRLLLVVTVSAIAAAACRRQDDTSAGAATAEGAVRGALEAANRGEDPSAFLLDGPRCRALYASKDAPRRTERGRASDEASCEQSATILRDELKRLPKGHILFSVGVPESDPFVGTSVPVTLQVDTDAFAPTTQWYALRVNGRYFAARKVMAPVAGENRPSTADIVPAPGEPVLRMTVADLRRAMSSSTSTLQTGDYIVIDGQYMGTDGGAGGADGAVWVGIVENASADDVDFTLSCRDPGLPADIEPGAKLTVSGVLHRERDNASLDPCFVK